MGWGKARTPRQQNQVLWGGGQILGRVGWAGKGNTDFFGVPDPMPAIVRVPQSSGHLFAKPCLHGGGRGGGGRGKGNSVSLCENSDGGSEGNNPNPYPVPLSGFLGGSPSLHLLPHVFPIPYLSVHPLLGGLPRLSSRPPGEGEGAWKGCVVSMVLYIIY